MRKYAYTEREMKIIIKLRHFLRVVRFSVYKLLIKRNKTDGDLLPRFILINDQMIDHHLIIFSLILLKLNTLMKSLAST